MKTHLKTVHSGQVLTSPTNNWRGSADINIISYVYFKFVTLLVTDYQGHM
jgi:hypothetical protein